MVDSKPRIKAAASLVAELASYGYSWLKFSKPDGVWSQSCMYRNPLSLETSTTYSN